MNGIYERNNGLEETPVRTIYVNNSNQIYVAYLNMVLRIDGRDKDKLEAIYTLENGLTSGHISCMVDDQLGNTWAGNNSGIITIRNGQEAFYSYLSAGNCSSVCRLRDGRLLWANSWGLIFFDPATFKINRGTKKLMLTDIEVDGSVVLAGEKRNGQIVLPLAPEKLRKLVLNTKNNDFRLYFSDLRYETAQRKIAYRLLPEDEDWKMQQLGKCLWYNRLPVGEYALQVKLVFPDGTEGDVIQVPIVVKAGWYRSVGAYWAYGVLIVILLYIIYWHFKRKNTRRLMHRDREILLRESLNVEKMKLEQKQEIDTMRNRLLMLFVQKLRTPLSLIIGPLKDMLEELKLIPGFAARGQVAYRNSLRMLDACNQLLAIYGHSSLNEKLQLAPYQVEKLIDNNLFDIREILKVYPIHFQYEKRVKKELEFYVDKRKVGFIIHNLLTNAFAHINYAGNVSLTISETMEENQHYVTITVEDDGNASINSLGQILPGNKMAGSEPGFIEVGFTVMQRMMEIHHGKISLVDSPEKNAKISVSFPLDKSVLKNDPNIEFVDPEKNKDIEFGSMEIAQLNSMAAEDIVQSTSGTKKTLLIVEDQRDIRLYLKILFDKEYNLLMATNGQEGVDMAIKELPDLIICDIMMPVKDGFECCREVKEGLETCGIPFIMLTAKVEDEDVVHGLEIGADDYVLKPFTPSILKAKVRALLNSRQVLKQMYTKLFMLPGADTAGVSETEQPDEHVKVEDPFISSVIKIVEDNIGKADFSVKKLAAEMNMSQPTLYRKVKQNTDYTIIELIRGVRMRRAAVLLKTKQYAVQEVAEMVGYNDIPTFRKHFVDAFGTTPSTYE